VGGLLQPFPGAQRDGRRSEFRAHDVGGQEVRLDELAERAADLVLAVRDDRRVRDRNRAVTANQSASAPTMPPSAAARTYESQGCRSCSQNAMTNAIAMKMSAPSAIAFITRRARRRS
jgi:hypothetical protein